MSRATPPAGRSGACLTVSDRRDWRSEACFNSQLAADRGSCITDPAASPRSATQKRRIVIMALYEMRTYTLYVGKMAEATKLYQELGFPALQKGGHDSKADRVFPGRYGDDQSARASVEIRR